MGKETVDLTPPTVSQLCPYWRKVRAMANSNWVLALCGTELRDELPFSDTDIAPRLKECPWYKEKAAEAAYLNPCIYAANITELLIRPIATTRKSGLAGIIELEELWEEACKEFKKRF